MPLNQTLIELEELQTKLPTQKAELWRIGLRWKASKLHRVALENLDCVLMSNKTNPTFWYPTWFISALQSPIPSAHASCISQMLHLIERVCACACVCMTANHKEDKHFPKEEQLWKQEQSEAGIFGEQAFCTMKVWGGSQHLFAQDRHPPIKSQSLRPCKTEPVAIMTRRSESSSMLQRQRVPCMNVTYAMLVFSLNLLDNEVIWVCRCSKAWKNA